MARERCKRWGDGIPREEGVALTIDEPGKATRSRFQLLTPAAWKTSRKWIVGVAACLLALSALYLVLLCHPGLFFTYSYTRGNITLRSDRPIPEKAAAIVIDDAAARLSRSRLRDSKPRQSTIYLCNDLWRFTLFANTRYRVGGLTYPPLTDNIFLRPTRIEANRLISPTGKDVPGDRTLSYYIAHEITHTDIAHDIGAIRYVRLPDWVDEGYCDYIAKGTDFSYDKAIAAMKRDEPEMDYKRSGLYLRYHLRVAHLLDHREISVARLFSAQFDPLEIEREILEGSGRR